ncbi:MAG: queuine tRNA-ribosyltransferase family protein, partial [Candidatus Accumulibacter sp.]|nr:queuine tRNA-ribosyltransferase family protein [Accumulibacter sp.]
KEEQRDGALLALRQVDETQRQAVLDEWAARCGDSKVRHPAGYLFGIVQKAMRGEFRAWAAQEASADQDSSERTDKAAEKATASPSSSLSATPSSPSPPSAAPVSREVAREHLARLGSILKKSRGSSRYG